MPRPASFSLYALSAISRRLSSALRSRSSLVNLSRSAASSGSDESMINHAPHAGHSAAPPQQRKGAFSRVGQSDHPHDHRSGSLPCEAGEGDHAKRGGGGRTRAELPAASLSSASRASSRVSGIDPGKAKSLQWS